MDADENPYQACCEQWDRYYRNVVVPQAHTLADAVNIGSDDSAYSDISSYAVSTARSINFASFLVDPEVDVPLTSRDSYSEDFSREEAEIDFIDRRDYGGPQRDRVASSLSETSSTFTPPVLSAFESSVNSDATEHRWTNKMINKYAHSPETSAYANELCGIFDDDHKLNNVDEPENLRITKLRDFSLSSMEDLRALPDPFPPKMRYLFE
ncbi:hypothetical protein PFISCL1PPCAC_28333 [Pristionchus fissidentatus]|uniref:Uncharacterized protein n=1 Tax=Pristionchus fissidentatus TaxID=1538716 RepID=A0AAV5WLX1_9BILA|nr:hypothetical protein PFISCL1PPCAC_22570 [Pristionchus fissidentatus]GMT37036.1 hypothetical protein PFISCL1PPCAC_28333 [Pristionchus fissidentatus]